MNAKKEITMIRNLTSLTASTVICLLVILVSPIAAKDDPRPPESDLQRAELASALAKYGKEHKDPLALIAAARIFNNVSKNGSKIGAPADWMKGEDGFLNIENIYKMVEKLAKGEPTQDHLVGLIEDARTKTRGWRRRTCWQYSWYCDWSGCRYRYVYYPC